MGTQSQLPNLDKIFRDDDDPDFVPSGGSNLAAIFGLQPKASTTVSPKQTASKKDNARYSIQQAIPSSSKTEVLIAKAIHAFKLVIINIKHLITDFRQNGQYIPIGKLGIALTGNVSTRVYQIILYKTKQEYVSVTTVTYDFVYMILPNNYASYYDNNKDNWSILFENNENYTEFAIEVGLARYFEVQGKRDNLIVYQDLLSSTNEKLAKEGDNICIKYFIATEIIQPFKTDFAMSQSMIVEISMDDNWERILLDVGKGLKRILFLPPSKQISLGPGFPKERDIMLIIEITDIRIPEKNPSLPKISTSGKAAIISRMAKMGQSILPKLPLPSTTDSEDNEDDIPDKSPCHKKIQQLEVALQKVNLPHELLEEKSAIQKVIELEVGTSSIDTNTYKSSNTASLVTPQWTPSCFTGHYVGMDSQMYSVPQSINRVVPATLDPGINMLLSETRITNAEIRMGMSKISDNVQKLLDKFYAFELQNATTPTSDKVTLDAPWKMLAALNASQLGVKDNELSKNIVNNMSEEKIREAQNQIASLENNVKKLQEEKDSLLQVNEDLNKKVQELEIRLSNINDEFKKPKEDLEITRNVMEQYKEKNLYLEERLSKCDKEHVLQTDMICSSQKNIENKNKEIKQIMNKTYHILLERLVDKSQAELSPDYVKSTLASTIKHITLQVLHEACDKNDKEAETSTNLETIITKVTTQQANKEQVPDAISNDDLQIKSMETSRSRSVMPIFVNEPPPVPLNDINIDSD